MALKVYGASASPFVRKVRVFLNEKNQPYEQEQIIPGMMPDWFLKISPAKRIPVLRDTDAGDDDHNTIADSSAICAYLDQKYPNPSLYPASAFDRAQALWFEEYADTALAASVGMGVFRPVLFPQMGGKEPDFETAKKTIENDLPPLFDYLEKSLGGRTNFVGDAFTIADVAVTSQFCNLAHVGYEVDNAKWPGIAEFVNKHRQRPSFAKCLDDEASFFDTIKKLP